MEDIVPETTLGPGHAGHKANSLDFSLRTLGSHRGTLSGSGARSE